MGWGGWGRVGLVGMGRVLGMIGYWTVQRGWVGRVG